MHVWFVWFNYKSFVYAFPSEFFIHFKTENQEQKMNNEQIQTSFDLNREQHNQQLSPNIYNELITLDNTRLFEACKTKCNFSHQPFNGKRYFTI